MGSHEDGAILPDTRMHAVAATTAVHPFFVRSVAGWGLCGSVSLCLAVCRSALQCPRQNLCTRRGNRTHGACSILAVGAVGAEDCTLESTAQPHATLGQRWNLVGTVGTTLTQRSMFIPFPRYISSIHFVIVVISQSVCVCSLYSPTNQHVYSETLLA